MNFSKLHQDSMARSQTLKLVYAGHTATVMPCCLRYDASDAIQPVACIGWDPKPSLQVHRPIIYLEDLYFQEQ